MEGTRVLRAGCLSILLSLAIIGGLFYLLGQVYDR